MALFLFDDDGADIGYKIFVGRTLSEHHPQVVVIFAEETGSELAVGSQPDA